MPASSLSVCINFNPLPPHGGRRIRPVVFGGVCIFQSTPSAWRETALTLHVQRGVAISIHSLRMEGDIYRMLRIQNKIISIHSLRMEGDPDTTTEVQTTEYFNPLPPHGGRQTNHYSETLTSPFQSTPSAWRETSSDWMSRRRPDISIHSLRMEGDVVSVAVSGKPLYFNPLPPHGGRPISSEPIAATISFQSTPSAWRETYTGC